MRSEQQGDQGKGSGSRNFVLFICQALACSLEVFLHKSDSFGERYLGFRAAAAAFIIFMFPAFAPALDPEPMWIFLAAYLTMCAGAKGCIEARRKQGRLGPHTFYSGTPRLFSRQKESTVKGIAEPVLVWIVSACVSESSPLLGNYLALAGAGVFITVQLSLASERKRVLDMHDAYMEQRRTVEDWRTRHRE